MNEFVVGGMALALVGCVGVIVWLVYGYVRKVEATTDDRVARVSLEGMLDRTQYEAEVLEKQLAEARRRAAVLEKELAHVFSRPNDPALPPGDVRSRVLNVLREWGQGDAALPAKDHLPASGTEAVPVTVATAPSDHRSGH